MIIGGRYRLVRVIGRGGQADVHEAIDESGERAGRLALKIMRAGETFDRGTWGRLRREVQLAALIQHPNVARIYGFGSYPDQEDRETAFITMELLEGETLSKRIARCGRLTADEALPIVSQIAAALDAAHARGVVHRDLKPANVMLVPGADGERAVVTDFGLARAVHATGMESLTTTGETVGTPQYMAPEQVRGAPVSTAVDVYALGVVMFELVTGKLPFGDDPDLAAQLEKLLEPAPAASLFEPGLPAAWNRAIARCLKIVSAKRFASPGAVARALTLPAARQRRGSGVIGRLRRSMRSPE
jgi:serine/threonine-protein kinase